MDLPSPERLHSLLKQHFGYDSFRPLQQEIIDATMAGKDVLALLPTGGGKSLCFQLPALMGPGLTLVVSPLIALMKDQVDQLQASGIPATFLNSTLDPMELRHRMEGLENGAYRLLYAAPERIMTGNFINDLRRWNVVRIAIDEAHCISEWGHDFRPEYRQLPALRKVLPGVPIMALTATATDQVREDIGTFLELKDPVRFTASFNRPNLTYRVVPKSSAFDQLFDFLKLHENDSGIVYCQSRKSTEQLAARLNSDNIPAVAYHAGLEHHQRSANQDLFLKDQVRVVCATIAFGMGINKPNVRFVVHYDLPKNLEGYYQETGRAGRDGLPGSCLLLYSGGDVSKYLNFISEMPDPAEAARQRHLLDQVVHYAEASGCRRRMLLDYFSEVYPEPNCGSCDNCQSPRETFDGTLAAQKLLSCVIRANQASRWQFGLGQYCDILCGANTEAIRKNDHFKLSTYGIGKEMKKSEWQEIGRELARIGLLHQDATRMGTLTVTPQGMDMLRKRSPILLTKPRPVEEKKRTPGQLGDIECDMVLFEILRKQRREIAEVRAVPPYVIFGDVALRHMARTYPVNEAEFLKVPGVGTQKANDFADSFTAAIREHLKSNARLVFEPFPEAAPAQVAQTSRTSVNDTSVESMTLYLATNPRSIKAVAERRGLAESTISRHLANAIESGRAQELKASDFLTAEEIAELDEVFKSAGQMDRMGPIKELVGEKFSWTQLQFFKAFRTVGKV